MPVGLARSAVTRLFLSLIPLLIPAAWAPALPAQETPAGLALLPAKAFDDSAAAHLLRRTGFAATPEEAKALAELGLEKAVEKVLDLSGPDPLPAFEPILSERPSRRELAKLSKEERQKKIQQERRKDGQQFQKLRSWWFRRMVLSSRPLEEKMTLFWHGHFATSQRDVQNSYHMYLQNRLLRAQALGNFKELVRAVAKDPAMLEYLDNNRNNRRSPNENFARELLELFTLGLGHYTEADIKEAARALTGWTFEGNEFVFRRQAHDPGEKTFLGRTGPLTGDEVIDVIFEQPAASRFVIQKLFAFFAHPEPPEGVLDALAAAFRESKFEVKPVLSVLFRSEEFYSPRARANRIKSPVELVAGTLRLLGVDPGESPGPAALAGRMGQDLFLPPNVKGWDEGPSWISTSTLFDRYNFARPLLGLEGGGQARTDRKARKEPPKKEPKKAEGRRPDAGRLPSWDAAGAGRRIVGEDLEKLEPVQVVERVGRWFLALPLREEDRRRLVEFYVEKGRDRPAARLAELVHLILSSPEYQLN